LSLVPDSSALGARRRDFIVLLQDELTAPAVQIARRADQDARRDTAAPDHPDRYDAARQIPPGLSHILAR
jgi:hypothetical protein